ncbi:MAG: 1-phosphofructokinase [Aerococcus sp.]|nr:1-phosphofructokinase [Aerococcus sp.]
MIYTITFNPAIDLVVKSDKIILGELNRSDAEEFVAGGKGINASVIFKHLDQPTTATGFLGGFTGRFIEEALEDEAINHHFIPVDGTTRVNVKLHADVETEINSKGPHITAENMQALLDYLNDQVKAEDVIFLAGNAATGLGAADYVAIADLAAKAGARFVLDTNKDLLKECLSHHPFIIKPNRDELGELFGVVIESQSDTIKYAKKLQEAGAINVLVSLGGEGSLLLSETGDIYTANAPKGDVKNSVGAGDSMLAGFISEYLNTKDYKASLKRGAATGSATAFSVGIATREKIDEVYAQINVTPLVNE